MSTPPPAAEPAPDPGSVHARAASFDHGARQYAATRPSYPDAAVDWLVPPGARTVLDLAAGTGKLTERLLARDLDVVAVEPSDAMRAELAVTAPGARALPGTAEAIPLPDASVDAVLVAQAWHWFSPAAPAEIARVLRPDGRLGIVWNVRDERTDWVSRFTEIIHRGDSLETSHRVPELGPAFGVPEHQPFGWHDRVRTDSLRPLAASRSYLLTLPPDRRDALLAEVDDLASTHPDLAGRTEVDLPYVARCWRAERLAS
ncbi:class I SAM-dependent methyltransferase [Cellulosimicrobium marinum]|uniref:class I SAM-dependent methyltransferase n=1 Tax=Cellulosimicrobium marinum TaxID=1638992 RepID=UPI001E521895|nr:class I SAM-dependent methyltransferase [Cellulosimicrobium marinum]MCB7137909.1 class I SAM-dependent methyltransferase [Cellulosimicrobium marinum]